MTRRPPDTEPISLALGVACWTFAAAVSTMLLTRFGLPAATLWLANSVAVLTLIRSPGVPILPGLLGAGVGIFSANLVAGNAPSVAVGFTLANLTEVVVTTLLLRRWVGVFPWAPGQLSKGLQVAMSVGPLASAVLGGLTLNLAFETGFLWGAFGWYASSACAALLVFATAWALRMLPADADVPLWQRAVIWGLLLASIGFVFTQDVLPLLFVPPALLTYFGLLGLPRQGVLAMLIVSASAVVATHLGSGPICLVDASNPAHRGWVLQVYVLALGLATIPAATHYLAMQITVRALQSSEAMAHLASQAKSDFLATMSHELRTPIAGVSGYTQLLRDTPLTPTQSRYLDRVETGLGHLRTVVGDVLDLSKIEAGALELKPTAVNLKALSESCLSLIAGQVSEAVTLHAVVDPALPKLALVDEPRLQQVLLNLLNNAAKFTEVGSVLLRVRPWPEEPGWVEIVVRDTGCGIPEAELPKVLERFRQASQSRERTHSGSGLGLHIAQQIVWAMGGALHLSSQVGLGTQVQLLLPLEEVDEAEALHAKAAGAPQALLPLPEPRDVLLVEDDPVMRELMELTLKRLGFAVCSCAAPLDALAQLEARTFDVLLSDLHMPGMDGFGLLRRARRLRPQLPAVLLTADATPQAEQLARASGFQEVLIKPVPASKLRELLSSDTRVHAAQARPQPLTFVTERSLKELELVMSAAELESLLVQTLSRVEDLVHELLKPSIPAPRVAAVAHQIKGTAGSMSLSALHVYATMLEDAARAGDELMPPIEALAHALVDTQSALAEMGLVPEHKHAGKEVLHFEA